MFYPLLINLCFQGSGVVENNERVYRSFTKYLFFIITNLLQREHQKLRFCLTEELEPITFTYIPCILIISFFFSPTEAPVNFLKNNFKIFIKTDIKAAPTCFGAVTPSSGSALLVLAKVTVVKIAH